MPGTRPGVTRKYWLSDKPELRPLPLCKLRNCLRHDDILEVRRLLMVGKRRFAGEHLVEEVLSRLGQILVDLELLYAGLALRLRQKILQQACDRGFFARIDLP